MIFHSIVNCIYASYKTLPVWSGRILTFLVKVKITSLEVRTTAKVVQFRKATRSKDKKSKLPLAQASSCLFKSVQSVAS